ncbi:hypothetical protein CEE45_09050 [Candidatus Heimdallarchaeota archaeon B3_Heim]|nr:MAG: hypothetical protein CEE45_09050 [Candidatus Heimdallarchaeota archaeon B3_Heim]
MNPSISNHIDLLINQDANQAYSDLETFLDSYCRDYDRFIFLYDKNDLNFEKQAFRRFLFSASELRIDKTFSFLLHSPKFHLNKNHPSLRMAKFSLRENHIIQKIALTYNQVDTFFQNIDLNSSRICIILYKPDRLCYFSSTLLLLHNILLSFSCNVKSIILTDNLNARPFYEWLAHHQNKELVVTSRVQPTKDVSPSWEFLTLDEISATFLNELTLPPSLIDRIDFLNRSLPEKQLLFSDFVPFRNKGHIVKHIRKVSRHRNHWKALRGIILSLLLFYHLHYRERLLIISNHLSSDIWMDFLQEYGLSFDNNSRMKYAYNSVHFLSLAQAESQLTQFISKVDRIFIDIGDEITTTSLHALIENFISFSNLLRNFDLNKRICFLQPLLIKKNFFSHLLNSSPMPYQIGYLTNQQEHIQELLLTALLVTTQKRMRKDEWICSIYSSWLTQIVLDTSIPLTIEKVILDLRLVGLLDLKYYQTTPLGRWFLLNEMNILPFLTYLQRSFPSFFEINTLSEITVSEREKLFFLCTQWFFQTTKSINFTITNLRDFQSVVIAAWKYQKYASSMIEGADKILVEVLQFEKDERPDFYHHLQELNETEPVTFRTRPKTPRLRYRGKAFLRVLSDLNHWMERYLQPGSIHEKEVFFDIRKYAQEANKDDLAVNFFTYIRSIKRILKGDFNEIQSYIESLSYSSQKKNAMVQSVSEIRKCLNFKSIKIYPFKSRLVLIHTGNQREKDQQLPDTSFLNRHCGECAYFTYRRKKDCLFYQQVAIYDEDLIPPMMKERLSNFFSSKVACSLWRPSFETPIIGEDLNKLDPTINKDVTLEVQIGEEFPIREEQKLHLKTASEYFGMIKGSNYVKIKETDRLHYGRHVQVLRISNEEGELQRTLDLTVPHIIDTWKLNDLILELADTFHHLSFNYRSRHLVLRPEDQVTIKKHTGIIPFLWLQRYRKRKPEKYPLYKISSVINIGKPRLTKLLKQWNIDVFYISTKGVLKEPSEDILKAISLPEVRSSLQQMHLLGLVQSALHATAYLVEIAEFYNLKHFSKQITYRMKRILYRSASNLSKYISNPEQFSLKQVTALEGWIFRPFAEGVREFTQRIQDPVDPMIFHDRTYGRTYTRLIWKKNKEIRDYRGGLTPFDAALNSINRTLRNRLRLMNAKLGLGYKAKPIFSHISADKPGRSSHLDLEEVGRILSRLVLIQQIAEKKIRGDQFEERFDDFNLPYYAPYSWVVKELSSRIIHAKILPYSVYYQGELMPFSTAHEKHVSHLCDCLKRCLDKSTSQERTNLIFKFYTPLIFLPKFGNEVAKESLDDFIFILNKDLENEKFLLQTERFIS